MTLARGTRIGPYEITAPLGAGGMGEVYAARDARLDRDVAIKVLPQHLTPSPAEHERLRREARTIAALNHPHICVLHDIGREGATDFLVMELVEGVPLARRLARGPLPAAEVLRLGSQIADALDRAHRAGVVHRDLKPQNVMLTKSGAKLMDFGIARAAGIDGDAGRPLGASGTSGSAHAEDPITADGVVVGTIPYMAPEQLEGKPVDVRSDIWSLGCVLYEMATGRRAFDGPTDVSRISAIMRGEPRPMSELAPVTPPALDRLVRQCLAKDPDDRWQTAGDLRRELTWILESGSGEGTWAVRGDRRRFRERLAWGLAVAATIVAAVLAATVRRPAPESRPLTFELRPPPQALPARFTGPYGLDVPRISPDGRHLAFNAEDSSGVRSIWIRHLSSLETERVMGTEGARRLFWSPDSRFLAFFSGDKLYKVELAGGNPTAICMAPQGDFGSWGSRNTIVFDWTGGDSIQAVPAAGGVPRGVRVPRAGGERVAWPTFLPDGRHFLYIGAREDTRSEATLRIGAIDSNRSTTLGSVESGVAYASRHVLYAHDHVLFARALDPRARRFVGDPFPVAENVAGARPTKVPRIHVDFMSRFSVSSDGTLVYQPSTARAGQRLVWLDRRGREVGSVGGRGRYQAPALSPDGTRLAAVVLDPTDTIGNIWIWELSRNLESRFTAANGGAYSPVWSPDGSRLAYTVGQGAVSDVHVKGVRVSAPESVLYHSDRRMILDDWAADGRKLTYTSLDPGGRPASADIHELSLGDTVRSDPVVATGFPEGQARISPDGRWLAYTSMESGEPEVYVRTFPGPGRRWRISPSSGSEPRWRGDGRELYYLTLDRRVMAVTIGRGRTPRPSLPHELFTAPVARSPWGARNRFDASRDGQRLIFVVADEDSVAGPMTVVVNSLVRPRPR